MSQSGLKETGSLGARCPGLQLLVNHQAVGAERCKQMDKSGGSKLSISAWEAVR
jgi:hypothetical protein